MIDVESWLRAGGIALLGAIVFAESGLLIGFFLPGDSLLFVAGFLSSPAGGRLLPPLPVVAAVAVVAAIAGDQVGYLIGRRAGPALFRRPERRLFNPANAVRARAFFERHGARAIVLARFVPIVRTFTPVVAGVGEMPYRTFVTFNVIGGALWGAGVVTLGHVLGRVGWIERNLEVAAVVVVALSLLPIVVEHLRARRAGANPAAADADA